VQLNVSLIPFKQGIPHKTFVKVNLTHEGVYAQADSMTSMAKSESNDFKRHYLPMIVMLGIGTMSFFIFKNLERRSADMIIFLIGGIIYFANVVMGWTEENKAFEKLPDEIQIDSQVDALELQKKSFEDVLAIAEKRYKMQMAATATFAAASIAAMMAYMKERSNTTQAQSRIAGSISDAQGACARDSQVASGQWLMAENREPLMSNCQRQTTEIANGLNQVQGDVAQVAALNERVADPRGSDNANTLLEQANDRLAEHAARVDHPVDVNLHRRLQMASLRGITYENQVIKKDPIYFEDFKTGVIYKMIPRTLHRENDRNVSYVEKYLTDEELKDFSKEDIDFLNFLKMDINLIDTLIAKSYAGLGSWFGFGSTTAEAAIDTASDAIGNEIGNATSMDLSNFNCSDNSSSGLCQGTSTENNRNQAYVQLAGGIQSEVQGAMAERAVGSLASATAQTSGWRAFGRFVAARAATVLVVAAGGLAASATAPIAISVAGLALTAMSAYELAMLGVAAYEAYSKNSMAQEQLENTVDDMGDFGANITLFYKKSFLDYFLPRAYAFSGLDVANNGRSALAESTGEGMREVDRFIFNPKGRMIVYGAVTALSGVIMASTKSMIENLKGDIEQIDGIIEGMNDNQVNNSRYLYKSINHILNYLTNDAVASKLKTVDIGTKLPCIQPIKNRKDSCANLKLLHRRFTPSTSYKNPEILNQAFNTITEIGNGLNGQSRISNETMRKIEVLASVAPIMVGIQENTEKIVNRERRKSGDKPLNFKALQNLFMNRMYKRTEYIFKKHNVSEIDLAKLTSGSLKKAKRTHGERKLVPNIKNNAEDEILENENSHDRDIVLHHQKRDVSSTGESYQLDDINKDSNLDIFKIISRRYLMIRDKKIKVE
jgi:hypothetical protein